MNYVFAIMLLLSLSANMMAQKKVRTKATISIDRIDDYAYINRHERDMQHYFDENREMKQKDCDVLFLGSSSINVWKTIYQDMAPMKIIRRSYGGSAIRDMIYNYDIIARGYNPKAIVLYCENDIAGSSTDITVLEEIDLFRVFVEKLRVDYPDVPVYLISLKPSPSRASVLGKQVLVNRLFEDYASLTDGVEYVDIASKMYADPTDLLRAENIRQDIWCNDRLHMNEKGYLIWTSVLKPLLLEATHTNE